ncbi:MAG: LicD family protein [Ruminococcaceae bacterium]|nr:LicD family protein [Oscillospiraceae bacterium]
MRDFDLKRLQQEQLDMLKEVDRICRKHGIKYMLFAGSALGAVRHGGFIPWDDDLDVCMLRPDYDKFLDVAQSELDSEKYYVQKEYSEHWMSCFSKIRKNNTAFMEKVVPKDPLQHQGIYIDIFPCDNLAKGGFVAKLQFLSSKIVIAKCLSKKGYLTKSFVKKSFMLFCRILPFKPFLSTALRRKDICSERVHSFFAASHSLEKSCYMRKWFTETVDMKFEDGSFPVSAYYDELLTVLYGDYMQIPPPEERVCKEHAILIDFDNSYEKYVGMQKNMKFDEFTKSIR